MQLTRFISFRFISISILGALPLLANCVVDEDELVEEELAAADEAYAAFAVEDAYTLPDSLAANPDEVGDVAANPAKNASFGSATIIRSRWSSGLCIDVPDWGRPPRNGDRLQVFDCHGGANQRFFFLSNGAIRTLWGGLCFDVPDYGRPPLNGDRLQVFNCHGGVNQQFYLPGDGTIRSVWGGLCVDIPDFGRPPQRGDYLQLYQCHGGVNQRFRLD